MEKESDFRVKVKTAIQDYTLGFHLRWGLAALHKHMEKLYGHTSVEYLKKTLQALANEEYFEDVVPGGGRGKPTMYMAKPMPEYNLVEEKTPVKEPTVKEINSVDEQFLSKVEFVVDYLEEATMGIPFEMESLLKYSHKFYPEISHQTTKLRAAMRKLVDEGVITEFYDRGEVLWKF